MARRDDKRAGHAAQTPAVAGVPQSRRSVQLRRPSGGRTRQQGGAARIENVENGLLRILFWYGFKQTDVQLTLHPGLNESAGIGC